MSDMDLMIEFCTSILVAVATFLSSPPIFYLFCLVCLNFVMNIVFSLLRIHH